MLPPKPSMKDMTSVSVAVSSCYYEFLHQHSIFPTLSPHKFNTSIVSYMIEKKVLIFIKSQLQKLMLVFTL